MKPADADAPAADASSSHCYAVLCATASSSKVVKQLEILGATEITRKKSLILFAAAAELSGFRALYTASSGLACSKKASCARH